MNPNDIVMIYDDPVEMESPEGKAKLIRKERDQGICQEWIVEFEDSPGNYYPRLIKV